MSETDLTRCTVCGGPFSEVRIHIDGKAYHQRCSIMSHPPHTWEDYARLSDECERLRGELQRARSLLALVLHTEAALTPADGKTP